MPNIDDLRRYAVLDPDGDETTLRLCMDAAINWYANAGVPPGTENPLYDLGVYMLAVHYYDNRGVLADKSAEVPLGVMSIMHQLRL